MIRDTSIESHAINGHDTKRHIIRQFVRKNGPVTRRQIAAGLGFETATVSGIVTPLVNLGFLVETEKARCPITGRNAYLVESAAVQGHLF